MKTYTDYELAAYLIDNGMVDGYIRASDLADDYDNFCSEARQLGFHFETSTKLWIEI